MNAMSPIAYLTRFGMTELSQNKERRAVPASNQSTEDQFVVPLYDQSALEEAERRGFERWRQALRAEIADAKELASDAVARMVKTEREMAYLKAREQPPTALTNSDPLMEETK